MLGNSVTNDVLQKPVQTEIPSTSNSRNKFKNRSPSGKQSLVQADAGPWPIVAQWWAELASAFTYTTRSCPQPAILHCARARARTPTIRVAGNTYTTGRVKCRMRQKDQTLLEVEVCFNQVVARSLCLCAIVE